MAARLPVFVFVLALSLAACASSGTGVKDSQQRRFQTGVTTEDDVLRALGPPTAVSSTSDGSAVLAYSGAHARAKAASFIPMVGISPGGATAEATSVAFRFDPDHRLMDYVITHGKSDRSMGRAHTEGTGTTNASPGDPAPAATSGPSHVRLGVHCTQITPELAQTDHLPVDAGVRVATVEAGSVAETDGVEVGDVLLSTAIAR